MKRRSNLTKGNEMLDKFECRFLIVDDAKEIPIIVIKFLKKYGFKHFHIANDGEQAINIMRHSEINMIIADWNMPIVDGIELLKTIRSNVSWENIPFIMLTAESSAEHVNAACNYKANGYIVKPFTPNTLIEKVEQILSDNH